MKKIFNILSIFVPIIAIGVMAITINNKIDFCQSVYGIDWVQRNHQCSNISDNTMRPLPDLER